jgi:hypothetical protein
MRRLAHATGTPVRELAMRADELSTKIASWWRWPFIAGIAILGTLGAMAASQYNEFTRASADIDRAESITAAGMT